MDIDDRVEAKEEGGGRKMSVTSSFNSIHQSSCVLFYFPHGREKLKPKNLAGSD